MRHAFWHAHRCTPTSNYLGLYIVLGAVEVACPELRPLRIELEHGLGDFRVLC